MLQENVEHDGERWIAPLLRRDEEETFPESRTMAEKRAISLEKRLDKSEEKKSCKTSSLAEMVYEKMEKMIADGHFRKLSEDELKERHKNVWYLPLLAVQNAKKPNKVRLVLDAAAKSNGKSLNDFLLQGPDNMNSIPGILCRWREKRIAVTSDVIAMFSQIRVREKDRPSQRFLWRGSRRTGPFEEYESPVVMFGATCSPSIAEHCFRRTADEFGEDEAAKQSISEDTYVDDIITGADSENDAVRLVNSITRTLQMGGFRLGPWASNSEDVLREAGQETLEQQDTSPTRTLGVSWDVRSDTLSYDSIAPPEQLTKRTFLSTMMSVYDPIGFLTGFLLRAKELLQMMWKLNVKWDERLPSDIQKRAKAWMDELMLTKNIHIPRHVFRQEAGISAVDLHAFCDASEKGFCAVLYYRWTDSNGCIQVSFVAAHSRVAPLKKMSIPRLELQAAVLACRMVTSIKKETRTRINSTICWSDSKNVLAWIHSTNRRYNIFVANRIAEIHDVTGPADWRYVPTSMNAADGGSRGHSVEDVCPESTWLRGPEFLCKREDEWPEDGTDATDVLESDPESKPVMATMATNEIDLREATPDIARFSRWTVAVRTVARIRRWLKIVREGRRGPLTVEEMQEAEETWIRRAQQDDYGAELQCLRRQLPVKSTSKLSGMTVGLVNDIICLDSRVKRSPELSPTARNPPLLPRSHRYTELLIQHLHQRMGHRAHDAVLVSLRQKCWVPQAARTIRSVVARCHTCRLRKGKPQSAQMAPLPLSRVTMLEGAFQTTGMDYFGPMKVKRGKSVTKIWGVLFRCLATRAIHIELTDSLDADAALMAISRFQARRGNVKEIWSDNGKNLTSANKTLRQELKALNQDKMLTSLALEGIKWRFISPCDPEAGGAWERAIRTVKDTLRIILKEQIPRFEILQTVIAEAEKIVNSTPLFHVPVDPDDDDVLTPFHFLIGRATPAYPTGTHTQDGGCLRRRWKHTQMLADHFWRRWTREYLPTLANRSKWIQTSRNVEVGDVVIVADPQHPRGMWVKGVVTDTLCGADGVVRSARVQTARGALPSGAQARDTTSPAQFVALRDVQASTNRHVVSTRVVERGRGVTDSLRTHRCKYLPMEAL